jgi:hypothetical protein
MSQRWFLSGDPTAASSLRLFLAVDKDQAKVGTQTDAIVLFRTYRIRLSKVPSLLWQSHMQSTFIPGDANAVSRPGGGNVPPLTAAAQRIASLWATMHPNLHPSPPTFLIGPLAL